MLKWPVLTAIERQYDRAIFQQVVEAHDDSMT